MFLSSFHPTSGIDIVCRQVYSDVDSLTQFYTVYTDGKATVTYWANSILVRVTGSAPKCVLAGYREDVPRTPFTLTACVMTPFTP